ncbi:MAG: hypothetical protein AAF525_00355 [Pseudomonadota bacterium]
MSQSVKHRDPLEWIPYLSGLVMLVFVVGGVLSLVYFTGFVNRPPQPTVEWTVQVESNESLLAVLTRLNSVANERGLDTYQGSGWSHRSNPVTTGRHHEWQRSGTADNGIEQGAERLVMVLPRDFGSFREPMTVRVRWQPLHRTSLTDEHWRRVNQLHQSMRIHF